MSDLKDLAFTVQQSVEAPAFETLTRRATHRRRRRTAFVGAAVAVVVATAILAGTSISGGSRPVPIAPRPTIANSDRAGEEIVNFPRANVQTAVATDQTHWAAAWVACPQNECVYAAVLGNGKTKAYTPSRQRPWATLMTSYGPVAVSGPNFPLTDKADAWNDAILVRLTDQGAVRTPLRYAPPTPTYAADEVVTNQLSDNTLTVLNVKDGTLRRLELPVGEGNQVSAMQDAGGNLWFISGLALDTIFWTRDRGKTWRQEPLDEHHSGRWLAVSPNGRTVVATSYVVTTDNDLEPLWTTKVSTDAGATWQLVKGTPYALAGAPVALDDGSVLMIGLAATDPTPTLYSITDGQVHLRGPQPRLSTGLSGDSRFMYGVAPGSRFVTECSFSGDGGTTWSSFEPR